MLSNPEMRATYDRRRNVSNSLWAFWPLPSSHIPEQNSCYQRRRLSDTSPASYQLQRAMCETKQQDGGILLFRVAPLIWTCVVLLFCQIGVGFGIAETLAIDFVVPMAKDVAIPLVKEVFNGVSRTASGPVSSRLTALEDCSSCRTNSLFYDHGFSLSCFPLDQQA